MSLVQFGSVAIVSFHNYWKALEEIKKCEEMALRGLLHGKEVSYLRDLYNAVNEWELKNPKI